MTEYPAADRRTVRCITLAATIVLHLLVICLWPDMAKHPRQPTAENPLLVVRLLSFPPQRPAAQQNMAPARPEIAKSAPSGKPRAVTASAPAALTPLVVAPDIGRDDSAAAPPSPSHSAESLISSARRDVGKIDRELRKAFPRFPEAAPESVQSRLARGIAAAGKSTWGTMEQRIFPDGRRMTRIVVPGGTYCVSYEGAGATDGIDQIQRGVQQKITNCDHFFD